MLFIIEAIYQDIVRDCFVFFSNNFKCKFKKFGIIHYNKLFDIVI